MAEKEEKEDRLGDILKIAVIGFAIYFLIQYLQQTGLLQFGKPTYPTKEKRIAFDIQTTIQ